MLTAENTETNYEGLSANDVERLITEASRIVNVEEARGRLDRIENFYSASEWFRQQNTPQDTLQKFHQYIKECWSLKHDIELTLKSKENRELREIFETLKKYEQRLIYLERETYLEIESSDGDFRTFQQKIRDTHHALMQLLNAEETGAPIDTNMNDPEKLNITPTGAIGSTGAESTPVTPEVSQSQVEQEILAVLENISVPVVPVRNPNESALAYEERLRATLQALSTEQKKASEADSKVSANYKNITDSAVFLRLSDAVGAKQSALSSAFTEVLKLQTDPAFQEQKRVESIATNPDKAAEMIRALQDRVEKLEESLEEMGDLMKNQAEEMASRVNEMLRVFGEAQSRTIEEDILNPKLKAFAEIIPEAIRETMAEEFHKWLSTPAQPVPAAEATPLDKIGDTNTADDWTPPWRKEDGTSDPFAPLIDDDDFFKPPVEPAKPAAAPAATAEPTQHSQPTEAKQTPPPQGKAAEIKSSVIGKVSEWWKPKLTKPAATPSKPDSKPTTQPAHDEKKPTQPPKPAEKPAATAEPAKPAEVAEKKPEPEKPLPTSLELAKMVNPAWTDADVNAAAAKAGPLEARTQRRVESAIQSGVRMDGEAERVYLLPFIAKSNAEMKKLIVQYVEKTIKK